MRQIHRTVLETILALDPQPTNLLDVGCGDGSFTRILSDTLLRTTVTATDIKPLATQSHQFRIFEGAAESLPFDDDSFDVITAALSLHHWSDKRQSILEAFRVLRVGGRLIIGDPLLDGPLRIRPLGWLAQVTDGGRFLTPADLRGFLNEAGFSEVHIETIPKSFNSLYLITATKSAPGS